MSYARQANFELVQRSSLRSNERSGRLQDRDVPFMAEEL
jgi:hypothetical protein